jgi:glycine/D-amino acid oxidase-like deaminating enzyme
VDVAVVGAGAVGATVAADLVAAGATVDCYDPDPGGASSGRAAGVCYDAHAGSVDARVADRAMERFREEGHLTACPYVLLAREGDRRRREAVERAVAGMRANDRAVERLDPGSLAERFPVLRTDDVCVAAVAENAGHVDTAAYVERTLARARTAGANLHERRVAVETDPARVVDDGGADSVADHDAVVVAVGAHTPGLLSAAGVAVPVKPYRVQALTARVDGREGDDTATGEYGAPMVYDATAGFYARPHETGVLAGDGTELRAADPDDYDQSGDEEFRRTIVDRLRERLSVEPSVERAWAGLCTATPDRDPLVGAVREDLFVAVGWHGHGFMRAPAVGELLAEAVLAGDRAPVPAFDPDRFDGDEEFRIVEGMVVD